MNLSALAYTTSSYFLPSPSDHSNRSCPHTLALIIAGIRADYIHLPETANTPFLDELEANLIPILARTYCPATSGLYSP